MKIVVTGGAGFIGSHLIDRLLFDGHTIINIDNFDSFYNEQIKRNNIEKHFDYNSYSFFEFDIRNRTEIDEAIPSDTDVIVHLAAKAGVRPSIIDPITYQDVNINGTQNLLELTKSKGIKKFIFASSSSVYGKNPSVPWGESNRNLLPISPYAGTKLSGELLGHVYSHLYGIQFLALRFFTVYGPRQRPDLAIHKFFNLIHEGKEITIYGDGTTRRDYTYIDDIIDGIVSAISYQGSDYEIINLGNNKTVELLELIKEIESVLGSEVIKKFGPEQLGDVKQTWADITTARKLLSYNPSFSLRKGLENFYNWYVNIKEF
ncbi:MAG: NAD-dependent epimerase/dehydratase family protein [Balneola sp.]